MQGKHWKLTDAYFSKTLNVDVPSVGQLLRCFLHTAFVLSHMSEEQAAPGIILSPQSLSRS